MTTLPTELVNRIKAVHSNLEGATANRSLAELNLKQAQDRLGNAKHLLTIGDRLFGGWAISNERLKEVTSCKDQLNQASEVFQETAQNYQEHKQIEQKTLSETLLITDSDYGTLKLALAKLDNLDTSLQKLAQIVNEISPAVKKAVNVTREQLHGAFYKGCVEKAMVREEAKERFYILQQAASGIDQEIGSYNEIRQKLGQEPLCETFGEIANKTPSEDAALVALYSNDQPRLITYELARSLSKMAVMSYALEAIDATVIRARSALEDQQTSMQQEMKQKESAVLKLALSL